MGLPVLRYRSSSTILIDILPSDVSVPLTDASSLGRDLTDLDSQTPPKRGDVFAEVDYSLWYRLLGLGVDENEE